MPPKPSNTIRWLAVVGLGNRGVVLFPVCKGSCSEADLEATVEVPLVFKAAGEGCFENAFIGGAEQLRGVVEPQTVDKFGWGTAAMLAQLTCGVLRRASGKANQGRNALGQMCGPVHFRTGAPEPIGRMAEWQVAEWF